MRAMRCILLIGLLACYATGLARPGIDKLSGWIEVHPAEGAVKAEIAYRFVNGPAPRDELQLLLDKRLSVRALQCRNLERFAVTDEPGVPLAEVMHTLSIRLTAPLPAHQALVIRLAYAGAMPLTSFNEQLLPGDWVESGLNYNCLTPLRADLTPSAYEVEIRASRNYQVFAPDQVVHTGPGRTTLRSDVPVLGFSFILGKGLQQDTFSQGAQSVTLVSYQAADSLKRQVVEMVNWCLDFYNRTFGRKAPKAAVLVALRPLSDADASYANGDNFFVTYDAGADFFARRPFHFGNISHEIGHFWWRHANFHTSDKWLNEGFAEYVSLRARRAYLGRAEFDSELEKIRAKVRLLPGNISLNSYDTRGPFSKVMTYDKGALLLYELEESWGEARFLAVLAEAAVAGIKTSREFVGVVNRVLGAQEAARVENMIDKRQTVSSGE